MPGDAGRGSKRFRNLLRADGVAVGLWTCDVGNLADGPEQRTDVPTLNIPLVGAFLRRGSKGEELVDPLTCSLSNSGDTWCTRHPAACRDTGIYVQLAEWRLDEPFPTSFRRLTPAEWLDWRVFAASVARRPPPDAVDTALLLVERQVASAALPGERRAWTELALDARARMARGDVRSVEQLAGALRVSPFTLCRSFRRATGGTVHAWLDRLRAIRAADAILGGAGDLGALALELGFAHHSHLTSRVRHVFGVTPTQLRRRVDRSDRARM